MRHDILITTTDMGKITLRCPNPDDMKKWLFTFQKSVALVYSYLVGNAREPRSTYGSLASPGITGISEHRTFGMYDTASGTASDTPTKRRSSVDNQSSEYNAGLLMASNTDRTIRGIESGIGLANDYSSYLVSRPAPAFGRMETINPQKSLTSHGAMNNVDLSGSDASFGMMQKRRDSFVKESSSFQPAGGLARLSRVAESSNNLLVHNSSPREPTNFHKSSDGKGSASSSYYETMVAASPAIPIYMNDHAGNLGIGNARKTADVQKVAGSYEDDSMSNMLAKAVKVLDNVHGSNDASDRDDDESMSENSEHSADSDLGGDLMFDLDDGGAGRGSTSKKSSSTKKSSSRSVWRDSGSPVNDTPNSPQNGTQLKRGKSAAQRTRSTDRSISPASFLSNLHLSDGGDAKNIAELHLALEMGTSVLNANKQPLSWLCGTCTMLGPRNSNEDRFSAFSDLQTKHLPASSSGSRNGRAESPNFPSSTQPFESSLLTGRGPIGYFAVYDGHCGNQAAQFLQDNLHSRIVKHPLFTNNLHQAITECCLQADKDFLDECKAKRIYCGTTCLGIVLQQSALTVFNIGDCLAVMGLRDGTAKALSTPHKPGRTDEEMRIKAAKGWITEEKELYMGRLHRMDLSDPVVRDKAQKVTWVTIHRVCGELAVSRSIGDPDYKRFVPNQKVDACFNWPTGHDESFAADLVIPNPDVETFDITSDDEFFIIASDGLWDVVSPQEAVMTVQTKFQNHRPPAEAAEELCELALKLGSSDNVTVVIVKLVH